LLLVGLLGWCSEVKPVEEVLLRYLGLLVREGEGLCMGLLGDGELEGWGLLLLDGELELHRGRLGLREELWGLLLVSRCRAAE